MSTDATPPPRKRRFRKTKIFLAVLLLLGLCFTAYRLTLVAMIHAKLDAIRKAGEPATLAELVATLPNPPPGENAADVYQHAFSRFIQPDETNTNLPLGYNGCKLPPRAAPLPPKMRSAIASYVAQNAETLRLVRKASAMRQCRFPVNWESGFKMDLRHIGRLKDIANLLRMEANLRTDEGDAREAAGTILASFGVANAFRDEPFMISHFVRADLFFRGFSELERALNRLAFSNEDLNRLSATVGDGEASFDPGFMLVAERCYMTTQLQRLTAKDLIGAATEVSDLFSKLKSDISANLKSNLGRDQIAFEGFPDKPSVVEGGLMRVLLFLYKATGAQDADQLALLELMREAIKASQSEFPVCLQRLGNIRVRAGETPFYLFITSVCFPNILSGLPERVGHNVARIRMVRTVLAVERFRNNNGRLPDQIEELVPKHLDTVPVDPYDGKPLRYRKLPPPQRGYVVYSVGENGRDDGGSSKPSRTELPSRTIIGGPEDITFTVER